MRHTPASLPSALLERALGLLDAAAPDRRALLGICGLPGAGKSTLADALLAELAELRPGQVGHVGMDAFHLADAVLVRHGTRDVKGAPHTFDAAGYAALLARAAGEADRTVYAPVFHREIEDSIAQESEIGATCRLVITEGNYLLLTDAPWDELRDVLDEIWLVDVDEDVRLERMVARHERYGRSRAEAIERTYGSDLVNADLVRARSAQPDLIVSEDPTFGWAPHH